MTESTLQRYKELSQQEQVKIPKIFPFSTIFKFKVFFNALFKDQNTELEKLLLKDDTTFIDESIRSFTSYDEIVNVGKIYNLIIPKSQSSNHDDGNNTPVLIFIHGLGGNLHQFDEQFKKFKGVLDILALDLPGSGKSFEYDSNNFKLTLDEFTKFVWSFIKLKGFAQRDLIFIGHSYGTQIILKLINLIQSESSLETNDQIKGVVLLAPPKIPIKRSFIQTSILKLFIKIPIFFQIFRKFDRINNINSHSLNRLFGSKTIDQQHDDSYLFLKFKQFKFNISTISHNVLTHALEWEPIKPEEAINAVNYLTSSSSPNKKPHVGNSKFLIVDGDEDKVTLGGGKSYRDLLGSKIDYEIIEKAGHNLTLDSYDQVNFEISNFINGLNLK